MLGVYYTPTSKPPFLMILDYNPNMSNRFNSNRIYMLAASLLILGVSAICCISCDSDTPTLSDVAIFVSPSTTERIEISSGEKAIYYLDISTIHESVANLTITSFDRQYGETELLNKRIDQKKTTLSFVYTAPEIDAEESIAVLTFKATDNLGNVAQVTRTVYIVNKYIAIPEKTGIVLYSPLSGMPDAITFKDIARPFVLADSPDPDCADIYIDTNSEFNPIDWRSNTKTKFIKNNDFNYTEATATSINAVYSSSMRYDLVTDIQPGDIIIVGHGSYADGVFLVTTVNRGENANNYMIVSYKGLEIQTGGLQNEDNGKDSDS